MGLPAEVDAVVRDLCQVFDVLEVSDSRPNRGGSRLVRVYVEMSRRHPAEATAARLLDHVEKWHDRFEPAERDALALVRFALGEIAGGDR